MNTRTDAHVALTVSENGKTTVIVRSLTDGALSRTYPAGTIVLRGRAIATCAEHAGSGFRNDEIVLQDPLTGTEARRYPLSDQGCFGQPALTRDKAHLVEGLPLVASGAQRRADARMVSLDSGTVADVEMPLLRGEKPEAAVADIWPHSLMAAVDPPGQSPVVILARGTAVLRLGTVRDQGSALDSHSRLESFTGDPAVIIEQERDYFPDQTTYISREVASGREIARTVIPDADTDGDHGVYLGVQAVHDHTLVNLYSSHGIWRLARYTLPDLRPAGPVAVTANPADPNPSAAGLTTSEDEGRILVIADGMLTDWDTTTLTRRGNPLPLATTDDELTALRERVRFTSRPGHPDELAVHSYGPDVALVDLTQRRTQTVHTELPVGMVSTDMVFDPAGTTLVILADGALHIASTDTGRPSRPPIPAPDAEKVLGFTPDGYLAVLTNPLVATPTLQLWDIAHGTVSGDLALDALKPSNRHAGDTLDAVDLEGDDHRPIAFPLVAQRWFDRLCLAGMPDFTPAERAALTHGAEDVSAPCAKP